MENSLQVVELIGTIDEKGQLHLDEPISAVGQGRVRVILLPEEAETGENEWLKAAASNPAFDFLKDPAEDIYTLDDGQPFNDQR
ncbi:MAG: hypothetical protein F4X75_04830 [Gemmatimonadetes bacterium]|nr:hypothetical protein [Gemmatimonadota bacterium]